MTSFQDLFFEKKKFYFGVDPKLKTLKKKVLRGEKEGAVVTGRG